MPFGQTPGPLGASLERRRLLSIEPLEDRRVLATFLESGTTLTLALGTNEALGIVSSGTKYTLSLTGGTWSGTNSADVSGNGLAALTVTAAGLAVFQTVDISDTGAGASVAFNNSGVNAYITNFTIGLHDSPAATGLTFNGASSFGTFNLDANIDSRIAANSGADVSTTSGDITLKANQGATPTSGNFVGIDLNKATISSATGTVLVEGRGGDTGTGNDGIELVAGAVVSSTGTGAGAATVTLDGTGGQGTNGNYGVFIDGSGSKVTSVDGAVQITGQGGGTGKQSYGIALMNGAAVTSTGNTASAATLTLDGTGANGTNSNIGVYIVGAGVQVSSVDGAINVTGQGAGTGSTPYGIAVANDARVSSTGTTASAATVTLKGTAGNGNAFDVGVVVDNALLTSVDGNLQVTGQAGHGAGNTNAGIGLEAGAVVSSTGAGANAATITLNGTGGNGTKTDDGFFTFGAGTKVTSVDGSIQITGQPGSGTSSVAVLIDTGVAVTTTGSGNITVTGDEMTIKGPLTTGNTTTGIVTLRQKSDVALTVDASPQSGRLSLTDGELAEITAGQLVLGRNDAGFTKNLSLNSQIAAHVGFSSLALVSGGAIVGNGGNPDVKVANLALRSGTGITLNTAATNLAFANSTSGNVTITNAGALTIATVDGLTGGTSSGDITIDTTGTLTVNAPLSTSGGSISLSGASIDLATAPNFGSANVTFITDSLTLGVNIDGTGTLTFEAAHNGDAVDIGGAAGLVTSATVGHIAGAQFSKIVIGSAAATGTFIVEAATAFSDPLEIDQKAGGAGKIVVDGELQADGITINGSGHTLTLNADLGNAGTPLAIHDAVVLGTPGLITLLGSNITLDTPGTINDDVIDTSSLAINGTGTVTLDGAIGNSVPIKSLAVTGALIDLDSAIVKTAIDQTYNGAVTLSANTALTTTANGSTGGNVEFVGAVNSDATARTLTITAGAGDVHFDAAVGGTPLASLTVNGTGTTTLGGDVTTSGPQSYQEAVQLGASVSLTTTNSNVTFSNKVNSATAGAEGLTVSAGSGNVSFGAAVGATALKSLTVNGTGITTLKGNVTTSGAQNYGEAVSLTAVAPVALTTSNNTIDFAGAVNGPQGLTITAGTGTVSFDSTLGFTTPLGAIVIVSAGGVTVKNTVDAGSFVQQAGSGTTTFDADVTLTGAAGLQITAAHVDLQQIAIKAAKAIFMAPVVLTGNVNIDTSATNGNITFGNTLDSNSALTPHNLTLNAGVGDIQFTGAVGTLGDILVTSARNVTAQSTIAAGSFVQQAGTGTTTFDGNLTASDAQGVNVAAATIDVQAITILTTAVSAPVSLQGAIVLTGSAIIDTQVANGPIAFGGALDSSAGGPWNLELDAGPAGDVTFAGAIGATPGLKPLGRITIDDGRNVKAAAAVNAASFLQTQGSGTTTLDGKVSVTGNGGVVITAGGIDLQADISSTAATAPVTFHSPVTLSGDVNITTDNGAVTFASTLGGGHNLDVTAGTGNVTFAGVVGGTPLAGLTISSSGTTTFDANVTIAGAGGINVSGAKIDVQTATITTTAAAAAVDFKGPVVLTGAVTIDTQAGNGPITFEQTLNSDFAATPHNLTLIAGTGDVTFTGAVGTTPLGDMLIGSAGNVTAKSTLAAGSFVETTGTGTTELDNTVTVTDVNGLSLKTAAVKLAGPTITADAGPVTLTAPVTLIGTVSIDTHLGNGNISFDGNLNSDATPRDLTLAAGTGNIVFAGAVGTAPLGKIQITNADNVTVTSTLAADSFDQLAGSGTTTFDEAITVTGATGVVVTAAAIDLQANIASQGAAAPVTFNAAVSLSGDVTVTTNDGAVSFEGTVDGAHALTITPGTGDVLLGGNIGGATPLASLTVNGTGPTTIDGNVATTGAQTYKQAVELAATPVSPAATVVQAMTTANSNVTFATIIDAATAGTQGLQVSVGTGDADFGGAVGSGKALASLTVIGTTGTTTLGGNVTTTGAQTYNEAVKLGAGDTLTSTGGGDVTFKGTVDGAFALTVNTAGTTSFDSTVGGTTPLASLTAGGGGTTAVNGPSVTTSGAQAYGEAVTLGAAATTFISTAGGDIGFANTLDGVSMLTVNTGGTTTFGGAVGDNVPLASLTTDVGGSTDINGGLVKTTGAQNYGDAVGLSADATLDTLASNAGVNFGSTVESSGAAHALSIDTTGSGGANPGNFGSVVFNHDVGGNGHPLQSLTIASGPFTLGTKTTSANVSTVGNVLITVTEQQPNETGGQSDDIEVKSGSTITSTTGSIALQAGDNISIDSGSTVSAASGTVTLQGDYHNNDSPAGTTINLDGVISSPTINVDGGSGNDTINIQQTQANTTTNVNEAAGANTINISSTAGGNSAGTLANIAGTINVKGSGNDTLNLDDRTDVLSTSGALTSSTVSGLDMSGTVNYSGLDQIKVLLGSNAGLAFSVQSTVASTPVTVTGQGTGAVNIGDASNTLDNVAAAVTIKSVAAINLNDQGSSQSDSVDASGNAVETYNITNTAVGRGVPGQTPKVLVIYQDMAAGSLQINGSTHVNNDFNVFLPMPSETQFASTLKTLKLNGGVVGAGFPNILKVVASQESNVVPPQTSNQFIYTATVGTFGSADPIQIQNVPALDMYGSPVYSNNFVNNTNATSVMIGGSNFDTLVGGTGVDVLFGGGTPQTNSNPANPNPPELLSAGGALAALPGSGGQDYVFVDYRPQFNADGTVSYVPFGGNGTLIHVDGGGGSVVSLEPSTTISGASSVIQVNGIIDTITWLTARFAAPSSAGNIINQALTDDPVLATLQAPPAGPQPLPVAGGAASAADVTYITDVFNAVLGRAPSAADLQFWGGQLATGLSPSAFATALTHSAEYYQVKVIEPDYLLYLGRAADAAGLAYWTAQMQAGLTDEQLEASFIASAEFYAKAGGTDADWVNALYQSLLGRSADSAGMSFWLGQLAAGESRTNVALGFTTSPEREAQRVTDDYMIYLGRTPDTSGLNYWVSEFTQGLMTNEDVIAGFVGSQEYFAGHS